MRFQVSLCWSTFLFLLVVLSPNTSAEPPPTPPPAERAEIYQRIKREKLRAAHHPELAISARNRIAQLYAQLGQYDRAIREYRFQMIMDPTATARYHRRIARIYEWQGDHRKARLEFELASLTRTKTSRARYRRRLAQWEREGNYESVIQEYTYLLYSDPDRRRDYLQKLARLNMKRGDISQGRYYYSQLVKDYRQLIKSTPDRSYSYLLRIARVYEKMGDIAAALQEYDRAAVAQPAKSAQIKLLQAELLARDNRREEALALYQTILKEADSKTPPVRIKMARLCIRLDRPAAALDYYRQALSAGEAGEEQLLPRIASLSLSLNNPAAADKIYRRLIVIYQAELSASSASAPRYHRKLADAYLGLKEYSPAAEQYREWMKADPEDPSPYLKLALLYRRRFKDEEKYLTYIKEYRRLQLKSREREK